MHKFLFLTALASCTETHLDLLPDSSENYAVGEGLDAVFRSVTRTCDAGDVYPAGCDMADAPITSIEVHGPLELTEIHGNEFRVFGLMEGDGRIELDAVGENESMLVPVVPIAYTRIAARSDDFDWRISDTDPKPAFAGSSFEIWQDHYREPRAALDQTTWMDHLRMQLNGYAPLKLDRGTTAAELVQIDDPYPFKRHPRFELHTNDVLGIAHVTTAVGGTFPVEIVDETAVAEIVVPDRAQLNNRHSYVLDGMVVTANSATGRRIAGCAAIPPTASDTKSMLVVTETAPCVFQFELAPGRDWEPTTIVIAWAGRTTEIPFVP